MMEEMSSQMRAGVTASPGRKRKAAFPFKVGTLGKTASIKQAYHNRNCPISQQHRHGDHSHVTRRWLKALLVQLVCWESIAGDAICPSVGRLRND